MASTSIGTLEGLPGGYQPGATEKTAMKALTNIISNALAVITVVAGLMFLLYFILGGLNWVTSAGEKDKLEKAKSQMTNAAVGLIIVVASYGIIFIIGKVLGINILQAGQELLNLGPK